MPKLILTEPNIENDLKKKYTRAFKEAKELYIVSAYLTSWEMDTALNDECENFKVIIGKDFGITKTEACRSLQRWLPKRFKNQFLIADNVGANFHPKAIFWKSKKNIHYALIGSSNLTKAAFENNYEANIAIQLTEEDFLIAKKWISNIEINSTPMTPFWLEQYTENINTSRKTKSIEYRSIIDFSTLESSKLITQRRKVLINFNNIKKNLTQLIINCSMKKISNVDFYNKLNSYWSHESQTRIQGSGYERTAKNSDFHFLCSSLIKIFNAIENQDDIVLKEIDNLDERKIPTRGALLSELLCLFFPEKYPILNKPVTRFLRDKNLVANQGSTQGGNYIHIAKIRKRFITSVLS